MAFDHDEAWMIFDAGYRLGRTDRAERRALALYANRPPECERGGPCIGREECKHGKANQAN